MDSRVLPQNSRDLAELGMHYEPFRERGFRGFFPPNCHRSDDRSLAEMVNEGDLDVNELPHTGSGGVFVYDPPSCVDPDYRPRLWHDLDDTAD